MIISKVKLSIGVIISGIILVSLLFIPTDQFFGTNSNYSISPPPILVLNNYHEDFEVISTSCIVDSDFVEINFSISNKLDKNYSLELHLLQKGINNEDLSREGIIVETVARKIISETHQVPLEQGLNICGIEIKRAVCSDFSNEDEYLDCKERYDDKWNDPKFLLAISSYDEKIIPTLEDFRNTLSEPYDIDIIFSKFGQPHDDIGSGIHIYVYELNDFTEIWIGYTDHVWYVKHVDSDGNVLEELFLANKN